MLCAGATAMLSLAGCSEGNTAVASDAPVETTVPVTDGDPFFASQWHLSNTGQEGGTVDEDAAVLKAWDNHAVFGSGVRIAVVDDGLEIAHEDLAANVVTGSYDYLTGGSDPTGGASSRHGTSVAGVAAAARLNGVGGAGAAPSANIVGYNLLQNSTFGNTGDAMSRDAPNVWISNNSWGPVDGTGELQDSNSFWRAAVLEGITNGRNGKGTIYVWAGGNGFGTIGVFAIDHSQYDGFAGFPYVIAVCAVGDDGKRAWYSERGTNLMVCAPSEGRGGHAITTTDRSGSLGYNSGDGSGDYSDQNYTNTFNGTSSATPLVAGVIALMLEANPNLTWRDVRLILAENARKNDEEDAGWGTNGAGLNINYNYGFGVIDADAMVARAKSYTTHLTGPWTTRAEPVSTVNVAIPNGSGSVTDTHVVSGSGISKIEFVQVEVISDHTSPGDLGILLTSPSSTESQLWFPRPCYDSSDTAVICSTTLLSAGYSFGTARHMNEAADGSWSLRIKDWGSLPSPGGTGNFISWKLTIYGR